MPRAFGVRREFADVPAAVRAWVEAALGAQVVEAETQVGGLSPGGAARLRTAAGERAFVKAVGASLSDGTADLFRHEVVVLSALPDVPYRTRLRSSYDDGDWVGLLLDDVDGRFPDLSDAGEAAAVWDTVSIQSAELLPPPTDLVGIGSLAQTAHRMVATWQAAIVAAPETYLPSWAVRRLPELLKRIVDLPDRLPSESLCHWDLREDNLLLRPDGSVVILDWGMARLGPCWADRFSVAVQWAALPYFDEVMTGWPWAPEADLITDLMVLIGGRLAWLAVQPARLGLPTMPALTGAVSRDLLIGARRRLADRE